MRGLYVMGVDGSGKSTLARNLSRVLGGEATCVLYAQHRPFLLAPVRWMVRRVILRRESEHGKYVGYRAAKQRAAKRCGLGAALDVALWCGDYVVTTWPRVFRARSRCGKRLLIVELILPGSGGEYGGDAGTPAVGQEDHSGVRGGVADSVSRCVVGG